MAVYMDDHRMDPNDPNYNSDEEPYKLIGAPLAQSVREYKEKVVLIVEEYFTSGDIASAAADLSDLGSPAFHHHFVKKVVSLALDRHDREKEMAAELLSSLYADVVHPDQVSKGFLRLLEAVDDLELDCPDAVPTLAKFVARAVFDDILPPAWLSKSAGVLPQGSKGQEVVRQAESDLASPHHAERVERCWGGAAQGTVDGAKVKIVQLLQEYVVSGDKSEACRCIRELNLPFFHHEVVKKALTLSMETGKAGGSLPELLKEAASEGLISSSQMLKGFARTSDALEDLSLDVPNAKEAFQGIVDGAVADGWLSPSFVKESKGASGEQEAAPEDVFNVSEAMAVQQYKERATSIVAEYFQSGDVGEVIRSLDELGSPDLVPLFVKKLVTMAMDRHSRERETASVLLSALYAEITSSDQIGLGFTRLLDGAEDLALDIPDAANELALFIARAVVDDILPPLYVVDASDAFEEGQLAKEVVATVQAMLGARHVGERLLRCWGGGASFSVEDSKEKIARLLAEYEAGGELSEACLGIRDLNMPFFHHEVVKKSLVMAMEKQNDRPLDLLRECSMEGIITSSQMAKGFTRVSNALSDLELDMPDAHERFAHFIRVAQQGQWLTASFLIPSTNRGFWSKSPSSKSNSLSRE